MKGYWSLCEGTQKAPKPAHHPLGVRGAVVLDEDRQEPFAHLFKPSIGVYRVPLTGSVRVRS